jgi:hypothetical protein
VLLRHISADGTDGADRHAWPTHLQHIMYTTGCE